MNNQGIKSHNYYRLNKVVLNFNREIGSYNNINKCGIDVPINKMVIGTKVISHYIKYFLKKYVEKDIYLRGIYFSIRSILMKFGDKYYEYKAGGLEKKRVSNYRM